MHRTFTRILTRLAFVAALAAAIPARAQIEDIVIWPPSASGQPGEIVTVDFRGDVSVPLGHFLIGFNIDREVVEFLGTEVEGTIVEGIEPRAIFSVDDKDVKTILIGANPDQSSNLGQTRTGKNLLLIRAKLRVRPDAPLGEHPLIIEDNLLVTLFAAPGAVVVDYRIDTSVPGVFTVTPPGGPRPVDHLVCEQDGAEMVLSWTNTAAYDEIAISRNGAELVTLGGAAVSHSDRPPIGPVSYAVVARSAGEESIPISCQVLMETPRPDAVLNLGCAEDGVSVSLSWENGAPYDSVTVLKNGRVLAVLPGDGQGFMDPVVPELFTVYSVRGSVDGVESFARACKLNEFSDIFSFRAEAVAARAGQAGVRVPIYATNPQTVQGFSVGLRIDPAAVRVRDIEIDGTRTEAFSPDFFSFNAVEATGEVGIGAVFDFFEDDYYTAAADQHVLTVVLDVGRNVPDGSQIPVELGLFGSPAVTTSFTSEAPATEIRAETTDGVVLVGQSPLAPVQAVAVEEVEEGGAPLAAGRPKGVLRITGILLSWTNADSYGSIRIERNGTEVASLPGDAETYLDSSPGPGLNRYRIWSEKDGVQSFPVEVVALPSGVPGTFLRGDANGDGRVDVSDVVFGALYLFRGGSEPECLDALDADDSGVLDVSDAVTLLHYLFLGGRNLPAPGTINPWFDPSDDDISCN